MNPTISHFFPHSGLSSETKSRPQMGIMKLNTIQQRKLGTINYKAYDKAYKPVKPFEIEGWDTETDKGLARVISTSVESKEITTPQEMLSFIFQRKHERTLNLFYNLGFDSEVILKWFPDLLVEIKNNGCEGSWDGIHAKIIPKKFFSLSKNHHTISFFDVAQYFNMTLENASEKYLGEKVSPLKQHREELFTKFDIEEIKTYCMDDAHKTKELGKCFIKTLNNLGIYTKRIYSAGYISQIYAINNTFIPNFLSVPFRVQEFYYAAYRGGWFDTYMRGTIKCVNYDLKDRKSVV